MNKRWVLAGMATLLAAGIVSIGVMKSSSASAPVATTEIGARINGKWSENGANLSPATFVPHMSDRSAINAAVDHLVRGMGWSEALVRSLPVRTTIGLFSGIPESARTAVHDVPVRVVVIEEVPISPSMGPRGITRATMLFDDATGDFLYGTLTGAPD